MSDWVFHDPLWLCLLLLLPLLVWWRRRRRLPALVIPGAAEWHAPIKAASPPWPVACAYVGAALLILALARPQLIEVLDEQRRKGYDFIIAIDLSTSMYAEDLRRGGQVVNRLQAINPIISAFINERPDDRIGIVAFAGRAYTFAPLTFDHDWLRRQTARLSIGLIEDGTAIGDAIGVSLARLREGAKQPGEEREGAFILLLTDGANNRGALDPRQAARIAAQEGVAVYTVGAGAEGDVPIPVFDHAGNRVGTRSMRSEIDSLTLRDIAATTGGLFFRVTDEHGIGDAFASIDQANKIDFDAPLPTVRHERYHLFASLAALLLCMATLGTHFSRRGMALHA